MVCLVWDLQNKNPLHISQAIWIKTNVSKIEETELKVCPIGLMPSEIHVNISFCNNIKNFEKVVKLDTHWEGSMGIFPFSGLTKAKISLQLVIINGNVKLNTCLTYAVSIYGKKHDVPKTELLWTFVKVNAKENPWTVTVTRRGTSQKTKVKNMGRREEQGEKDTKGKHVNWLHILALRVKTVKLYKRKCNALSNGQIDVFKMSIVWYLTIIPISAKFVCNKLIPY